MNGNIYRQESIFLETAPHSLWEWCVVDASKYHMVCYSVLPGVVFHLGNNGSSVQLAIAATICLVDGIMIPVDFLSTKGYKLHMLPAWHALQVPLEGCHSSSSLRGSFSIKQLNVWQQNGRLNVMPHDHLQLSAVCVACGNNNSDLSLLEASPGAGSKWHWPAEQSVSTQHASQAMTACRKACRKELARVQEACKFSCGPC